ncbi:MULTISPECIES: helix-turn-helix transcriptional regulator [unclassified Facklamia]|uniref:helix-turn-helix domain-containing protein n=1 Tax=Aerococcaceae TaxID=186827 RepID=UPI0013BDECFE|nr:MULTISPECIES: helix-turn-helix transcriptional regulator [unclassified Facklamia]MBS4461749.1 helix-turn-helix transcriptional regulator [Aerococcaceae bacterium zg-B36]NEW63716.1 helix-turn-helix domain-containing protein [Facklamia sp. 252]NEW67187.1 helix-turn-helix domain-containing protein [Facklamia sp. 253]QQD66273.1 helix-turn-helix transcriptional regulator [Aerococcaceae bacterium zg-252]
MITYNKKIKDLRLQLNMTQNDLAKGITSQSVISKIEKGLISPDIDLLQQICERLNTSLATLLDEDYKTITLNTDYIDSLLEKRDYVHLEKYLSTLDISSLSSNQAHFIEWIKLVIQTACYGETDSVIEKANHLITLISTNNNKFNIELKINLYLLIANIYEELKDINQTKEFLLKAYSFSRLPIVAWNIQHKILYGLSRIYYQLNCYEESYQFGLETLEITISNHTLMYLEDILLVLANASIKLGSVEESKEYINQAEVIAKLKLNNRNLKQLNIFKNLHFQQ